MELVRRRLPRPERLYFAFGAPLRPGPRVTGEDERAIRALRDRTKTAVEVLIASLREEQARDKARAALATDL